MEWKPNGTMRLHPFELIQQESGIQVRYRYDWHIGAMPERYTYDKTGQKLPLNELALGLIPGDYGRAVCNLSLIHIWSPVLLRFRTRRPGWV